MRFGYEYSISISTVPVKHPVTEGVRSNLPDTVPTDFVYLQVKSHRDDSYILRQIKNSKMEI